MIGPCPRATRGRTRPTAAPPGAVHVDVHSRALDRLPLRLCAPLGHSSRDYLRVVGQFGSAGSPAQTGEITEQVPGTGRERAGPAPGRGVKLTLPPTLPGQTRPLP